LKTLWALATNQRRERSMAYALNQEGLPLLGTHHRAADDAFNIARIGEKLLARLRASSPAP
jgi:inhibitor of KinA sporulation pathway (predicted exonuclease)